MAKETVQEYIDSKCLDLIRTYIVVGTEFGLVQQTEFSHVHKRYESDVDKFYDHLTEAVIAKTLFEDYIGSKKTWQPIHRKKFKQFLGSNDYITEFYRRSETRNIGKKVRLELKPFGAVTKHPTPDPPNMTSKRVNRAGELVEKKKSGFKFYVTEKEASFETILDFI